jgi:Flp pilus assembly pilin Flp
VNELVLRLRTSLQAHHEDGQAMVEYALLLTLVSVVAIVILTLVGTEVNIRYNNVAVRLGTAVPWCRIRTDVGKW